MPGKADYLLSGRRRSGILRAQRTAIATLFELLRPRRRCTRNDWRLLQLIKWALIFAAIALVFAVLGFGGLAGAFFDIAKILFWLAVIIAVLLFVLGFTIYKKVT